MSGQGERDLRTEIMQSGFTGNRDEPNGWFHDSNGEAYVSLAEQLVGLGLDVDTTLHALSIAFTAAAGEFGL